MILIFLNLLDSPLLAWVSIILVMKVRHLLGKHWKLTVLWLHWSKYDWLFWFSWIWLIRHNLKLEHTYWWWRCRINWRSVETKPYFDFTEVSWIVLIVLDLISPLSAWVTTILVTKVQYQLEKHWKLTILWFHYSMFDSLLLFITVCFVHRSFPLTALVTIRLVMVQHQLEKHWKLIILWLPCSKCDFFLFLHFIIHQVISQWYWWWRWNIYWRSIKSKPYINRTGVSLIDCFVFLGFDYSSLLACMVMILVMKVEYQLEKD